KAVRSRRCGEKREHRNSGRPPGPSPRGARQARLRRQALRWLAQSGQCAAAALVIAINCDATVRRGPSGTYCRVWEFGMRSTDAGNDVSEARNRTRIGDGLLFARNFFRPPRMLGSIIPSSRFLIRQLLQPVDWQAARVIVEYGPGVGNIT